MDITATEGTFITNTTTIQGVDVEWTGDLPEEELTAYVERGLNKYGKALKSIRCIPDGDEIDLTYDIKPKRFQRLRRITGYLVGDMSRWNNGKRAEEHDRVKHGVDGGSI